MEKVENCDAYLYGLQTHSLQAVHIVVLDILLRVVAWSYACVARRGEAHLPLMSSERVCRFVRNELNLEAT